MLGDAERIAVFDRIHFAHSFSDFVDGEDPSTTYRRLAKMVHPDLTPPLLKERATKAFAKLSQLYADLTKTPPTPLMIVGGFEISSPYGSGDICDFYRAESADGTRGLLKVVKSESDNDLLENEIVTLTNLRTPLSHFSTHYLPEILSPRTLINDRAGVILRNEEDYFTLEEILAQYHTGLDFRHVVWMMKRALALLGFLAHRGVVHGAIFPQHLLFSPKNHGFCLLDWCYSTLHGRPAFAVITSKKSFYPKEVLRKFPLTYATDIYMLASCFQHSAITPPMLFKDVLNWMLAESPNARPNGAWDLADRWSRVAEEVYGPPKFVELNMTIN